MAVILCDLDGVVVDCITKWMQELRAKHHNPQMDSRKVLPWNIPWEAWGITWKEFEAPLRRPGFFRELSMIKGAALALETLHDEQHEIVFVTVPPENAPTAAYDKEMWVRDNLPWVARENVVCCRRKDIIRGDILIDDKLENLLGFVGKRILFDRTGHYEGQPDGIDVVTTGWYRTLKAIRKLLPKKEA